MDKLIINTKSIASNIETMRRQAGVQIIGSLDKAGYGCGARFLARTYVSSGVQMLCASDTQTVKAVMADYPNIGMLLTCPNVDKEAADCIINHGATATIADPADAAKLNAAAEDAGVIAKAHLLIRSNKNGFGITYSQAERAASVLRSCRYIEIDGAYTDIAHGSEKSEKAVAKQYDMFMRTIEVLNDSGVKTPMLHMTEGYTALRYVQYALNAVRMGCAAIGRLSEKDQWQLIPVGEIETEILGFATSVAETDKDLKTPKDRRYALIELQSLPAVIAAAKNGLLPFGEKKIYCFNGKKKYRISGASGSLLTIEAGRNELAAGDAVRFSADPRLVIAGCGRGYE